MLRVLTLGGLTAKSAERPSVVLQPRLQGFGLLARLAAAGERGVSRDKLIAYFWPERDERSALHSLSQALHRLRGDLGVDELLLGTRILRLDPAHVSSDVGDLEDAHRAGDDRRLVELYAGPFLDGIFFGGAPEFERWVEDERRRLATLHAAAVRRLAVAASTAGNHEEAASCWQRLLEIDPLDSRIALALVHSLVAAGEEAAAVREARVHQALVRSELQREPDERVASFLAGRDSPPGRATVSGASNAKLDEMPNDLSGLSADQLCAHARQCFITFTSEGLTAGVRYAERAIQLDPQHAQAHVTLAWLRILLSQAVLGGDLRARAAVSCRRAAELDPALADAPLALAWLAQLDERFDEADVLARRAVDFDPTYAFAHFILGWVHMNHGFRTGRWERCAEGAASMRRSLCIHPRDPHALMDLSVILIAAGRYDGARELLERAVHLELAPAGEIPMIAALTLLGLTSIREGRFDVAREHLQRAMVRYAGAPQIFAPYVNALTLCGLGDLNRFAGLHGEAVSCYTRARSMLEPMPGLIGAGYLEVRLQTRLAAVMRPLRMRPQEEQHLEHARRLTRTRTSYSFNWCWGVSEAELHYDWAVYHASCANRDAMYAALREAADFGWREVAMLEIEPAFAFCRTDSALERFVDELRALPTLHEERPAGWTPGAPAATERALR